MNELKKSTKYQADAYANALNHIGIGIGEALGKFVLDRVVEQNNRLLFSIATVKWTILKKYRLCALGQALVVS